MVNQIRAISIVSILIFSVISLLMIANSRSTLNDASNGTITKLAGETQVIEFADAATGAPMLGVVVDESMRVLHIEPGSVAQRADVRSGDMLETLDGIDLKDTANRSRAKERIAGSQQGQTLILQLSRNGQVMTLDIISAPGSVPTTRQTPTLVMAPNDYY